MHPNPYRENGNLRSGDSARNIRSSSMNIERYLDCIPTEAFDVIKKILWKDGYQIEMSDVRTGISVFFAKDIDGDEKTFIWEFLSIYFSQYTRKYKIKSTTLKPYRSYVNCHPAYHPSDWHLDSDENGITMIYYPDIGINYGDEGGLEIKDHGIEPYIPNSLIIMPANILHRAQMHTMIGKLRFSIAIKLKFISD